MTSYTIRANGPIKLPNGVTVGDEFRIAGKARITAIAEDLVEVTGYSDEAERITSGARSYTIVVSEIAVDV